MRRRFALNKTDMIKVFTDTSFKIISTESTSTSTPISHNSILDVPNLGHRESGRKYGDRSYILQPVNSQIYAQKSTLEDGQTIWLWNNHSIDGPVVNFSGSFQNKIIIGEIAVQSHLSAESKRICNLLIGRMRRISINHHGVSISKEYYDTKKILTYDIEINPEYDFQY